MGNQCGMHMHDYNPRQHDLHRYPIEKTKFGGNDGSPEIARESLPSVAINSYTFEGAASAKGDISALYWRIRLDDGRY